MRQAGYRLDPGDDGDSNSYFASLFYKSLIGFKVVKHLGNNILGSLVNLILKIVEILFKTRSLKMLFGIPCHTNAKIGWFGVFKIFEINTFIHIGNLPDQTACILIPVFFRYKFNMPHRWIASQRQKIGDSKIMQVN